MLRCITARWRGQAIVYLTLAALSFNTAFAAESGLGSGVPDSSTSRALKARASKFSGDEIDIPSTPTAPPSLIQSAPPDPFRCHRRFIYQGRTMECDSNIHRDGENLRPIIKDVPEAISELDAYQHSRRALRTTAYLASAGLLVVLIGYLGTRGVNGFRDPDTHALTPMGIITLSGIAFSAGSFIYGFTLYKTNDSRLTDAVSNFNKARPETPIELEFKTGINF